MPSLSTRRIVWTKLAPEERLKRWIARHGTPPATITKRPLKFQLPHKLVEANGFDTNMVVLTAEGDIRLRSESGIPLGKAAQ